MIEQKQTNLSYRLFIIILIYGLIVIFLTYLLSIKNTFGRGDIILIKILSSILLLLVEIYGGLIIFFKLAEIESGIQQILLSILYIFFITFPVVNL